MSCTIDSRQPPSTALSALIEGARLRLEAGTQALRKAYETEGRASVVLQGRTRLVDAEVKLLWEASAMPDGAALLAVGGYGRGELFPASDIDLLILLPAAPDPLTCDKLSAMFAALWDIGLHISHAVRTVEECVAAALEDIATQTSLLEIRLLAGARERLAALEEAFDASLDLRQFYKAKLLEQEQRYARFNDSPYALEPNCKDSPGGLRDLQLLSWIALAARFGPGWRELARQQLITANEATELRSAERFLQHLRIRLHYHCGRAENRLLFDHQEALAQMMAIKPSATRRASEVLMQRYYVNAKTVSQLNTILLHNYAAVIFPGGGAAISINARFQVVREFLDIRHEDVFSRHPSALFECFLLLQQRSELRGMTARTLRALWAGRKQINAAFRAEPEHQLLFMQILQHRRGVGTTLRRMNDYGVLARYLPGWRQIVGQMQHDLFHVYTVDQHILMVVRNLRSFGMGEHAHEYPLMSRLLLAFDHPWVLYVAALFHDIAKGRGGDHSLLGMVDAREFCRNHRIAPDDSALIIWLVEHHLTMSHFAQKEDCSDPEVLQRFADIVGDERRLSALYLLTHADIRGTSPKVWSNWKGRLLENLFHAVQRLLRGASADQALGLKDRRDDARRLLRYQGLFNTDADQLWAEFDELYFMRHSAEEIAWHAQALHAYRTQVPEPPQSRQVLVKARHDDDSDGIQVMVYAPDDRDLFVRLTAFFARHGFTILEARVHTTRGGHALDSFVLQYPAGGDDEAKHIQLIERQLVRSLQPGQAVHGPAQALPSRQVKHFPITPEVRIRADESGRQYILTLTAADRPGLLFAVAEVLAQHDICLHTARISTMGERVEDTFLLSGAALAQENQLLRIERELLDRLQA